MVACSRARASWRAIVSRPELTPASWAIRLARSTWVDGIGDGSSLTGGSVRVLAGSMALAISSSVSGGPGGRLSRSRTLASSAKLLSVIEPSVPLLFLPLLDEDIVMLPEMGTAVARQEKSLWGHGQALYDVHRLDCRKQSNRWVMIRPLRALTVARAEGTCLEWNDSLLGFLLCRGMRQGGQPVSADRLSQRRAVNGGFRTCRGCRLPH